MKLCLMIILTLGISLAVINTTYAENVVISTIDGSATPIAEKVMVEAYKRMGKTLEIKKFPAERSLQVANNGEVDGDLYRKKDIDKSYPNLIVIPVPIVSVDVMVFTKGKKFAVKGWESLLSHKVGYRIGIKVIEDNLVKGTKAEAVPTLDQLFKKLDGGRNDVVVETRLSGLETISKLGLKKISMLEPPLIKSQLYHCLNVKNKNLVEPLTAVLRQMEKEGVIQDIQKKAEQQLLKSSSK
jgi:polar amino acid transport system substrate-binding protein